MIQTSEVDDFVIIRVRAFARKVQRALIRDVLADENMPVLEWQLMFSLARFGSCHLAHVTNRTSIDPAHGSRAAAALEKKGLVERHEDPANRRRKMMSLTAEGMNVFDRIWPRAQSQMRRVTDQLGDARFEEFKQLLGQLNTFADILDAGTTAGTANTDAKEDNNISV